MASAAEKMRTVVSIATEHPQLMEEANLKVSYTPGKAGGTFGLPLGGRLVVPEGFCGKKETFVCKVSPPSQRWRHNASFKGEHLTSEIFTLSGNVSMKQRTLILIIPYAPPPDKFVELNVKGIWKDESTWTDVGFINKDDTPQPCVELQIDRLGTFAVTFRPKTDQFQMTSLGGLYHSRLNRNVSFRLPKKAIDSTINYNLQIEPIPEDRLQFCREYFFQDCQDMEVVTEIFNFNPDASSNFKRVASIKLPLPLGVEVEGDHCDEIVVLHKEQGKDEWEWVDSKYKYTRNSVSFDVKSPYKLVVVKTAKAERQRKMQSAMAVLEDRLGKELGEASVFMSLKEKSWMLVVEVYRLAQAQAKRELRESQGFIAITKSAVPSPLSNTGSFSRRPPPVNQFRPKTMESFELKDGLTWDIQLTDDLAVADSDTDMAENKELCVFKFLKENYRRFFVQPKVEEERPLKAQLLLLPKLPDSKAKESLTLTFDLEIPYENVRDYFFVPEPEPEPEPKKPKKQSLLDVTEPPKPKREPVQEPQKRTFSISAMERLTQPTRKAQVLDKEAKVLTGKSLMALSKVVTEGLTLAVHLGLPDSTITGIGFDALSNGRDMSDVGYRILLYWKRMQRDKREGGVQALMDALKSMGKHGVAEVVLERHQQNKELTVECFLAAAVHGIDLS